MNGTENTKSHNKLKNNILTNRLMLNQYPEKSILQILIYIPIFVKV